MAGDRINLIAFARELIVGDLIGNRQVKSVTAKGADVIVSLANGDPKTYPAGAVLDIQRRLDDVAGAAPGDTEEAQALLDEALNL